MIEQEPVMLLTYDPRQNLAYLRMREPTSEVQTIRLSDEVNVDLAADGTLYGIELLNANEQLRNGQHPPVLEVLNQLSGKSVQLALE